MTRLVAEHFLWNGQPKRRWRTASAANQFRNRRKLHNQESYRCSFCGGWHLGQRYRADREVANPRDIRLALSKTVVSGRDADAPNGRGSES